jgi:hypothetical protein
LFLSQWGANIDKIREAAEKMSQKAIADGFHKKTENYRDIRIEIILNASGTAVVNYCFIKDCLILSTNPAALKFLIAHLDGAASATLADEPDYSTAIKAVGPYHDVDFYMNIKKLISGMLAEEHADQAQMIAATIGINNISFLASSAGLARQPGLDINARTLLKIDGPKKGICKILDIRPAALQVPRFVPSPTHSVLFLNLDIKKAYNEFYSILYNFSPMHAGLMFMPLLPPDPDGQPGLQLKNDIIDHLGCQIIISQSINKPFSTGGRTPPVETLIAVQLDNRNELEKSLARLHSLYILSKNPDAKRQLLGHTIYIVTVPALGFLRPGLSPMHQTEPSSSDQMCNLAFTVIDTYLILGTQQTVEQAIRTLNSPASESITSAKWFNKAKSAIPSIIGVALLEDNQASSEFLWWLIKQKKSSAFPNTEMAVNSQLSFKQENANLFNPVLLPDFETVRKHFGLSSFYGITRPDGFFFEFKYLKPQNE